METSQANKSKIVTLSRDIEGILVPFATPIPLPKDEQVVIVQSLGGNYTVNFRGNLARINEEDLDAIGETPAPKEDFDNKPIVGDGTVNPTEVTEALKTCYDPEIPVNIFDLGLIYDQLLTPITTPKKGNKITITMTLTAPGCGMGPILALDVERKLKRVTNITEVEVKIVFDPPWDKSMMSEAAKLQLGML